MMVGVFIIANSRRVAGFVVMKISLAILLLFAAGIAAVIAIGTCTSARPSDEGRNVSSVSRPNGDAGSQPAARDVYNFGFVLPESKHTVFFAVDNLSDVPLQIIRVKSECACIIPINPPKVIPAKSSAGIQVDFVAPKENVKYSGKALLFTSDKSRQVIPLQVDANVGLPLDTEPKVLNAGCLIVGEGRVCNVEIINNAKVSVKPVYAISNSSSCVAIVPAAGIAPQGRLAIPISITAEPMAATMSPARNAVVAIQTDCEAQRRLDVPVKYSIDPAYSLPVGKIDLGNVKKAEARTFSVEIAAMNGQQEFVKKCEMVELSNLAGSASVRYDGSRAIIEVKANCGEKAGLVRGKLILELAGHDQAVEIVIAGEVGE
jgi:hypothetical protein